MNVRFSRVSTAPALALLATAQFASMTPVEPPRTSDARVVLTTDKTEYFIGENVLIHFCVENVSGTPISVEYGGDYRGGSRSNRFKVTATSAAGAKMPDPDPQGMNLGGLGGAAVITGADRFCESLPLARYAQIDQPGEYVVRVFHDLGWKKTPPPEGEIKVRFAMPTAEQIEGVIAAMLALPPREAVMRRLSAPYQDFSALGHPMYLPELKRLTTAGVRVAIPGVASIRTPDATRVLIDLLSHPDRDIARDAALQLWRRMPSESTPVVRRDASGKEIEDPAQSFRDATWRPEFAHDVRTVMHAWLKSVDAADVDRATVVFRSLGRVEDVPTLLAAIDRALVDTLSSPSKKPGDVNWRWPLNGLQAAMSSVIRRGYTPPASPQTPAECFSWLVKFSYRTGPADWADVYPRLLYHNIPYIRIRALRLLPADAPPQMFSSIGSALRSEDPDEQLEALGVVGRSKLRDHAAYVEALARSATDHGVVPRVLEALKGAAGAVAVLTVAADRIVEGSLYHLMADQLWEAFEPISGSGTPTRPTQDELKALSARWKKFIAEHRKELESGKRFGLEDPAVTADLLPAGWTLYRQGKPEWPKR